ncbi:hypothetical protein, partial [Klebsiella quasipneumoniae]|uniref:hypothetical protein n=1 Tax=Klebsiella quasipneumoniae TaxID=1463165 RepID=UPI002B062679
MRLYFMRQYLEPLAETSRYTCKYPGKADHSHLEIFLHTDYVPGGDRHAQSPIHRTPDHCRSE